MRSALVSLGDRRQPLARGKGLAQGKPLARGDKPLARGKGLDRGTPLARGDSTLARGKPMDRGAPLARGTADLARGNGLARTAGPARSTTRPSTTPAHTGPTPAQRAVCIARAGGRCERCGRGLDHGAQASVHHRRPRGQGGTSRADTNAPSALMLLCGSGTTGCHGWVESNRERARDEYGYLVRQQHDPASVPVVLWDGRRVLLDPVLPRYLPVPLAA